MSRSPSDGAREDPAATADATSVPSAAPTPGAATTPAAATSGPDRGGQDEPASLDEGPAAGIVRLARMVGGAVEETEGSAALERLERAIAGEGGPVWVDLEAASPQLSARIARILGLHPLLLEDIAERDQRAKLEQVGADLHLVMFSLGLDDGEVYDRELDFVLGRRFLLSSHSRWWDPRATTHLRMGLGDVLRRGPDYLLWALADDVVDACFPILDRLGDEIDALEDEVVGRANRALLERLFALKRQLIQIRRVTAPEREMFNALSSREGGLVGADERLYFRDAYDHLVRLTDELDTYRELVSATLETYLSTVNNNLSLIMKRLTGVTVVLAGIGAIGGLFGMSEAQYAFRGDEGLGFWVVLAGCTVLAAVAVAVLRRIDWI